MIPDDWDWPVWVAGLDQVPEAVRNCYIQVDEGFELPDYVREAVEKEQARWQAELAEKLAAFEVEKAKLHASTERMNAELRERVARSSIHQALVDAGAILKMIPGATALLLAQLNLTIEERDDGELIARVDGRPVQEAVSAWLTSAEGEDFALVSPVPGAGMFSERARGLRGTLH